MNKLSLRKVPLSLWIIGPIIIAISVYIETSTPLEIDGLYWTANILLIVLFSYYGGPYSGIILLLILSFIYMVIGLLPTTSELPMQQQFPYLLGAIIALSIGTLGWKIKSNDTQLKKLFDNNDITFWTWDVETDQHTFTEGFANIYGVSIESLKENPYHWQDVVHPDDKDILMDSIEQQKAGKKTTITYRFFHSSGEIRWLQERATPHADKTGAITHVDGVIFDITDQKQAEQKMNQLIHYDSLTGLTNRKWFQNYLETALISSTKFGRSLGVMFIDYDNFKRVNDTLGHSAGDQLLILIAERLKSVLSSNDVVSRQSGDEFLVLVENRSLTEIEDLAQKIIVKMNAPYKINGTEIISTPSIGISVNFDAEDDAEALIKKADFAMFLAKENGKNNYQFYNDELNQQMRRKMILETHLHKAIEKNELSVHYQPQFDIATYQIAGAEALLRWEGTLGKIPPDEFIPIAEETGLILPIGEWVLRQACRDIIRFREKGINSIPISVNISTRQLME